MFIKKIKILKFRGFKDIEFELGKNLTAIAGQNGTQKTTALGLLTQPFTITNKENPIYKEKPLSGGTFKSAFSEKFKLSENFDKPKNHEWTIEFFDDEQEPLTLESMVRDKRTNALRFWKKGDRSRGSGYFQLPVIFLSLSRLFPIGEEGRITSKKDVLITSEEKDFLIKWHNKILLAESGSSTEVDYLQSSRKNTLGVTTEKYDWKMNSAGQDNIGKILLAILSFKRLKENFPEYYSGGILAIDEIESTLYPASQLKLLDALRGFSSSFNIQIVFTTHSLEVIKSCFQWKNDRRLSNQVDVIHLKKVDGEIEPKNTIDFEGFKSDLNVDVPLKKAVKKINVFGEDEETIIFFKNIFKKNKAKFNFIDCKLGCGNLITLRSAKIPGFLDDEAIIALDGDVVNNKSDLNKIKNFNNVIVLPGGERPENMLAKFLYNLSDRSDVWDKLSKGYNKQFVFKNYSYAEVVSKSGREKAKKWFKEQAPYWGRECSKLINVWVSENLEMVGSAQKKMDDFLGKIQE